MRRRKRKKGGRKGADPRRHQNQPTIAVEAKNMGAYTEYLDRKLSFQALTAERKRQLARISELRGGRDVLVFAASLSARNVPTSIEYSDLLPIRDQLAGLGGKALDLVLETPGGSGEVAEDIVRLLRSKYPDLAVIVPGWAKSAGTIITMAGDEILMESSSALGPIDAQIIREGKVFSADALIEGMDKIKEQVEKSGKLNLAYVPILQALSPGEIQHAENALKFARKLVTDWLATYKFKNWVTHSSTGLPVTDNDKRERAEEVAKQLCDHRRWLTHARSINLADLRSMRLKIEDYSDTPDLADAIRRYYTLLQITFSSNIYKVFETPKTQILRGMALIPSAMPATPAAIPPRAQSPELAPTAHLNVECGRCGTPSVVQANLGKPSPLTPGARPFPPDNRYRCPNCGLEIDLSDLRRQVEAQSKRPVVA
jgi:Serine dehydrogenase proteinase